MSIRIYQSKNGWYLFGTNYKDKEDKAYCNLFFPQNREPKTTGDYIDINILEAKGTSYKGKFGLTIFKYDIVDESQIKITEDEEKQHDQQGSVQEIHIEQEELPFY